MNASAHQFANPGFLDEIIAILKETGLAPELLKLEVTESGLLGEFGSVEEVLSGARALAIGLALDDFGTGYSSLTYLLKLPFDVVKIDRSFVRHMNQEPHRAEMVRMVIHLAQALGMRVVAEGVETEEELSRLRELDCHLLQGYLLSRPVTGSSVEGWLEADHREGLAATSVERAQGTVAICGLLGKQLAPVELLAFEEQGDRPRLYRRTSLLWQGRCGKYERFCEPKTLPYIERVAQTPEGLLVEFSHGPIDRLYVEKADVTPLDQSSTEVKVDGISEAVRFTRRLKIVSFHLILSLEVCLKWFLLSLRRFVGRQATGVLTIIVKPQSPPN